MALAELATENPDETENFSYALAHGLYGQAWALYEQLGDVSQALRAMLRIGQILENPRPQADLEVNAGFWYWNLLQRALVSGTRYNQAETFLAMSRRRRDGGWHAFNSALLAFATYHITGHVPSDVETPNMLSDRFSYFFSASRRSRPLEPLKEETIGLYQARGDHQAVGYILLAYGEVSFWAKDYDDARLYFERARQHTKALNDRDAQIATLRRYMRLAHRIHDYDLYKECHAELIACLIAQGTTNELASLWLELALIASDHHEWSVARQAYQSAAMAAVLMSEPLRQIEIYWQWGQMEYHRAKRREMGLSLMQWALSMAQIHTPDQAHHYERTLRQMRLEPTR